MVFTVTVCLLLLIGYIYGIWKQWKLSAGKIEYADDQIWEPFERAKGVFELTVDRLILPLKKLRGILPKNNKKDEEE
jgi:hypothetical protein